MKRVRVASAALGLTSSRRYLLAHGSAAEAYLVHDRPHHCPHVGRGAPLRWSPTLRIGTSSRS